MVENYAKLKVSEIKSLIKDVDKICRICLNEKAEIELTYLYNDMLDKKLGKFLGSYKPRLGDGLPSFICQICTDRLNMTLDFKQQCQTSEKRLRQLLTSNLLQTYNLTLKELLMSSDNLDSHSLVQIPENVQLEKRTTKSRVTPLWSSDDDLHINEVKDEKKKSGTNKSKEKIQKCTMCKKVFCSVLGLKLHLRKHGINLECEICGKKFNLIKQLNSHMRTIHKDYKPYSCKLCSKSFVATNNLTKHMRVHGGERKHLCNTCGRRFFESGHLAVHMRTHTGEKPIACKVCDKRFADPHGLIAHNKIHTGERKYECKTCGKRFAHSFVLTAHNRIHTGEKPFQCSVCGVSFATSSYLTIHKRTHTQEKPFNCEYCSKAFVSRTALVAHQMIHTGEKRFQCNVCGRRMARAADLNVHMRSHTGERPYSCDQCPKKYHTSSNLSAHKRTHTGIKNHICKICDKAFGDSRTLKSHTRIHTGEKPYVCQYCGNRYSQSGQLSAHRKTHLKNIELNNGSLNVRDELSDNCAEQNIALISKEICPQQNVALLSNEVNQYVIAPISQIQILNPLLNEFLNFQK